MAFSFLASCQQKQDTAAYVTGLRVLGIKATPPEVAAGGQTTLTAIAVDTRARAINVAWAACLLPALPGQTVNPDCIKNDTADYIVAIGNGLSVNVALPAIDAGSFGLPDSTGGYYLPVRAVTTAGDATLTATYRLRINQGAPPNQNPALDGIYLVSSNADGGVTPLDIATPLTVRAGESLVLRATFGADGGGAEPYTIVIGSETRPATETLNVAWFATAGSFSEERTGEERPDTVFRLDEHLPETGTTVDIWAVARDERGGLDYLHRTLRFE